MTAMRRRAQHMRTVPTGWRAKLQNFRKLAKPRQLLVMAGILAIVLIVLAVVTTIIFAATLSSKERIMNRNKTGVTLQDASGTVFYEFNNARSETYVPLASIAPLAQKALISAEDKDFYKHAGFSITGFINAIWQNIKPDGTGGGGSTITQQLVKNALLTADRNFVRKYQELVLSVEIERRYSKDEILEMYLNSVYFGEGAFGIEDAAKAYFGKSAKDLSLAESSMLIGLLPSPSAYSPITGNPEFARERQVYVLDRMAEDGIISASDAEAAKAQALAYQPAPSNVNIQAPHFALMVKEELEAKYGEETIARSGYKVKTTLNLDWQTKAEAAVEAQVGRLARSSVTNGSTVIIDPKTGEIKALVGSKNYNEPGFGAVNMATATRQPGSSFKPIVYATGIEDKSLMASTIFEDKLTNFGGYAPRNYNNRFNGNVSLRYSLANSLNVPAVLAMQKVGVQDAMNTAKSLGITTLKNTPEHYGLPLALGSGESRLDELTNAYATLANGGLHTDMRTILTITDKDNKEIFRSAPKQRQAISSQTSFIMSSILSDNAARSPTFGNSLTLNRGRVAAVKTGTTEDYRDALTVGYTPSLAIGVWIGNNDNSPMSAVAGSSGSGPIWRQLMQDILGTSPVEQFSVPSGVVQQPVCRGQNAIADSSGDNTFNEYFRASALPSDRCNQKPVEQPQPEEPVAPPAEEEDPEETPPAETPPEEEPGEGETPPVVIPTPPIDP